ncbi:hypothetical protein [Pontibacter sp. BAB1700]|uniref:hypothetical protein n=1 Tax=Pontibacter sp. BAB1700 TaxID=1144253 RepID=UPI00026BD28F|nr:hypothetical protein [Pontibacter sp. BAB1700]EJF08501.1 hypothetical protein O71_20377 [Pontibacter sp. BAB1700]
MKTLFTLALFLISFGTQAQRLLGYTQNEVLSYHKKNKETSAPEFGTNNDGNPYITYTASGNSSINIVYYFNRNICYSVAFIVSHRHKSHLLEQMMKNGFYYEDGFWYHDEEQQVGTFKDVEEDGLCVFEVRHWD